MTAYRDFMLTVEDCQTEHGQGYRYPTNAPEYAIGQRGVSDGLARVIWDGLPHSMAECVLTPAGRDYCRQLRAELPALETPAAYDVSQQ